MWCVAPLRRPVRPVISTMKDFKMGIVNAKLLADNLLRINGLKKVELSDETIASAARDKTGDSSITPQDIASFCKLGNIGSNRMLISAKQGKKLTHFARDANVAAAKVVENAKEKARVRKLPIRTSES